MWDRVGPRPKNGSGNWELHLLEEQELHSSEVDINSENCNICIAISRFPSEDLSSLNLIIRIICADVHVYSLELMTGGQK